ncbi:MAG: hypothetical protein KBS84_08510, partial [Treponema sp.]|nr:hypothetical protein [Candidatus Treponema scatequi]
MSFISQEAVRVVNTIIDIINIIVLFGIFIHACFKLNRSHEKKVFLILLSAAFAYNLGDMANWTCEGFAHPWNVPVLHIFTFMSFVAGPLIYVIFMRLVRVSYKDKFESNKYYFLCLFSCGLSVLMGFLSCFPGFLYYFDANNVYHRTQFHIIVSINTLLYYLFSILYICSCRKKISKKEFLILLSFPSFPVLMYVPQIVMYGIATLNVGITISILIIYKAVLRKMKLEIVNSKKSFTSEFFVKQNVTFWERIRRGVFYYGYSEGAINSVKQELSENVAYMLKFLSLCVV